jgi:hypothetical protein
MDTRFKAVDTTWEFWIVGDEISDSIKYKLGQGNKSPDVSDQYDENGYRVTVRAVTWAQIIQNARHRLKFVKDQLGYDPTSESGMDYLRVKHGELLPSFALPEIDKSTEPTDVTKQ